MHWRADSKAGPVAPMVLLPPVLVMTPAVPSDSASITFVSWTGKVPAADEGNVRYAVAMVPLGIVLVFKPERRHVFPLHEIVFPADVATGPACTLIAVAPGTLTVHCNPAVFPVPEVNDRGTVAVVPEITAVPTASVDEPAPNVSAPNETAMRQTKMHRCSVCRYVLTHG